MKLLCATLRAYASDTIAIGEAAEGGLRLEPQRLVAGLPIGEGEGSR
jgi:hypothetical protein